MTDDINKALDERETHPAFGKVGFARVQVGSGKTHHRHRLFGSSIDTHHSTVLLRIHRASHVHYLSSDSIFADKQILEVELSEAQFSSLLTTMNVGDGVPCTIRYTEKDGVTPPLPHKDPEVVRVKEGFSGKMEKMIDRVKKAVAGIREILDKPTIPKRDRKPLMEALYFLVQDLEANAPFIIEQFGEATEKVVRDAKADIDSFVTGVAIRTGLERLKEIAKSGEASAALPAPEGEVEIVEEDESEDE